MASALTTSAPSASARRSDSAVLPLAVGPARRNTGGRLVMGGAGTDMRRASSQAQGEMAVLIPDKQAALNALDAIRDPKSGKGIVAAGLVKGLVIRHGR